MIRSLERVWNVSPGFDPNGVLTFYTSLSPERASDPQKIRAAFREINERLSALPGVTSASIEVGALPLSGGNTTLALWREDQPRPVNSADYHTANFYAVGPDHFTTMHIPLIRGRSFTWQDDSMSPSVAMIDEEFARSAFPGQDPIGKRLRQGLLGTVEIVGIVGHVKHAGLDADAKANVRSQLYTPFTQLPDRITVLAATAVAALVRSNTPPAALLDSVRKELGTFDGGRPVHTGRLMNDVIATSLASRRFSLILIAVFAAIALVLSMIGIYGVVSYFVGQRTNEIGIRVALGANPGNILCAILGEGGKMAAAGIALGLAAAALLTRLMASLLFGVSPTDLLTFGAAATVLFGLTLVACYIPARRALGIDPMVALRHE
jgi:predicted permease